MSLALLSGQPFSEVCSWEPEAVQTALNYYEDRADAERDAQRGAAG